MSPCAGSKPAIQLGLRSPRAEGRSPPPVAPRRREPFAEGSRTYGLKSFKSRHGTNIRGQMKGFGGQAAEGKSLVFSGTYADIAGSASSLL
jgi:hypothetical protein